MKRQDLFPKHRHRNYMAEEEKRNAPAITVTPETKMNVDNAKSQMRKGMLEYCVLLLLSREACYANDIIKRLKAGELIVVEGTLYPLLSRLKKDGLLSYEWRESSQGPPRKYYALTDDGHSFLTGLDGVWNELARTVNLLRSHAEEANGIGKETARMPEKANVLPTGANVVTDNTGSAPADESLTARTAIVPPATPPSLPFPDGENRLP